MGGVDGLKDALNGEMPCELAEVLLEHMQKGKYAQAKEIGESMGQSSSLGGMSFIGPLLADVAWSFKATQEASST